jgi:ADP-ribose pyrophosphatase YjhB (NUDIX family)
VDVLTWVIYIFHNYLGELLERGVEREVFKETGIRPHFRGILAFTYKQQFRFGTDIKQIIIL